MRILRFFADKLHGYLTFELAFNSNLVFLTGINGSGKTSAVRAIASLLTPSLLSLAEMEFELISVVVDDGQGEISIVCKRSEDRLVLSCSSTSEELTIPILAKERFETPWRYASRRRDFYSEQEAINAQNATLAAIDKLPSPMYLDVDRRNVGATVARREGPISTRRIAPGNPLAGSTSESLRIAENIAEKAYLGFSETRTKQTDTLKQELVLAAFRPFATPQIDSLVPEAGEKRDFLKKMAHNVEVLPFALSQIGVTSERIERIVLPFFERARQVLDQVPSEKEMRHFTNLDAAKMKAIQEWSGIRPQLRQVERLVDLIEKYNSELGTLYLPFKSYLDSVNSFLAESQKRLFFGPGGSLSVLVREEEGGVRPIQALSSGERQLVVILTHLAFNSRAKLANVLIIDEPELSLHLRWQELFVDAIVAASPGIQLILATHSPAIIGNRVGNCIDVLEARKIDRLFT
jgi:energy-coupling factor transporter ATP-binding protein EcfA2